jgi:hypothetical protein
MEKLTTKQRGDAAEHYVISMLGFNSVLAAKIPDNWPGYDLVAQPPDGAQPLRISVRFRIDGQHAPYVRYKPNERFDFIALVYKRPDGIRTWILPRSVADKTANGTRSKSAARPTRIISDSTWSRPTATPRPDHMIRIAISQAAFEAIAATLPLGSVNYENHVNERGERYVWLVPDVVNRLRALRGPNQSYSDVILALAAGEKRA